MAASFPGSVKTWTPVVDNVDEILAVHVNDAYEEIIAIETAIRGAPNNIAQNTIDINRIENTINQMNPTGDAKVAITGYDTINSLPKNVAQAGLSVIQGGMTVQNLLAGYGNFENDGNSDGFADGLLINDGGGCTLTLDSSVYLAGTKSQKIVSAAGYLNHYFPFVSVATHVYYAMQYIKTDLSVLKCGLTLGHDSTEANTITGDNVWRKYTSQITATGTSTFLGLSWTAATAGTINEDCWSVTDLTAIAEQALTMSQVDVMLLDYFNGTQSAVTNRVKSVGKQLFDKSKAVLGYYVNTTTGNLSVGGVGYYASDFIRVQPSISYKVVHDNTAYNTDIVCYDSNKTFIIGLNDDTVVVPFNVKYIRITVIAAYLDTCQVSLIAGAYESYKSTEQYCLPLPLYRVPNGVRDTVENGKHIQRVQKYTLQAGDISALTTTGVNIDYVRISLSSLVGIIDVGGFNYDGTTVFTTKTTPFYSAVDADAVAVIWQHYQNTTQLIFIVPKGIYADLAAAQAALTDTVIYYQLTTPIVTDNVTSGTLLGYPSGTVYYEPVIADIGVYDTNLAIFNTDYPVISLECLYKIDMTTGAQLELDPTTATIASGGLTFTHASLASGDLVGFTYFYSHAYPYGENSYTYFDSNVVSIDTVDGKAYRVKPVVTSGAIASWALTEVV